MPYRRDIIYLYDGTFDGLMTAVFASFEHHEIPLGIEIDGEIQQTIGADYFYAGTDTEKSRRVQSAISGKISAYAMKSIYFTFLSDTAEKEMKILAYIYRCFKYGKGVNSHLNDKYVAAVLDAARSVVNEAHKLKGFIRFAELEGGILYGEISPRSHALPCLASHFTSRYPGRPFVINDLTHGECLVYNGHECGIREAGRVPSLKFTESEMEYRRLWKEFYDTVEIKERHNEKCRMTNMPKRYWKHLTEMDARQK